MVPTADGHAQHTLPNLQVVDGVYNKAKGGTHTALETDLFIFLLVVRNVLRPLLTPARLEQILAASQDVLGQLAPSSRALSSLGTLGKRPYSPPPPTPTLPVSSSTLDSCRVAASLGPCPNRRERRHKRRKQPQTHRRLPRYP